MAASCSPTCATRCRSCLRRGQDHLKGKIIRIAHLGYMGAFDIVTAIAAFEMALRHFGHPVELGRGVGARRGGTAGSAAGVRAPWTAF